MKKVSCLILLLLVTTIASVRAQTVKIDSSSLLNELISLGKVTPQQADSYLTGKSFSIFNKTSKDLGIYTLDVTKYKTDGSKDSYGIGTVKNATVQVLYITYSDNTCKQILDAALKAGFKENKAADKPDATAYDKGSLRILFLNVSSGDIKFHVLTVADFSVVKKAADNSKKN